MENHKTKIKKIKKVLNDIAEEMPKRGRGKLILLRERTEAIEKRLVELGKDCGYEVARDRDQPDRRDKRAWLYDLTWWSCQNGERNDMTSIELAVESEWNNHIKNLKIDFAKLVHAKAKLKLFIFRANNKDECKATLTKLKNLAELCEDKNDDKYLLSCYIEDDGEFIHNDGFPAQQK